MEGEIKLGSVAKKRSSSGIQTANKKTGGRDSMNKISLLILLSFFALTYLLVLVIHKAGSTFVF